MLDAAAPPRSVLGLTLFRDHQNPSLHYVMPEPPRIAGATPDAPPSASVVLFRGDASEQGGGLFEIEVDLSLGDDIMNRLVTELASQGVPNPVVQTPSWLEGTARLLGALALPKPDDPTSV